MSEGWCGRLTYLLAVTLVVAGLTHLAAVLLLLGRSSSSAYASLAAGLGGTTLQTLPLATSGRTGSPFADPALPGAACLYDLRQGPVSVTLEGAEDDVASLSIHDRHGRLLGGLTGRSRGGRLALTVVASGREPARRPDEPKGGNLADIRIEAADPQGFALAEVLARAPSEFERAETLVSALSCRPATP